MRFRTFLSYLSLLPLSACTKSCNDYDNNEEFSRAQLPIYTETGAGTLGCQLGSQKWTVLGKHQVISPLGSGWSDNLLQITSGYGASPLVVARGEMTGVRDSKAFYDTEITLIFRPNDTLGGLRLLGADTTRVPPYRGESIEATSLIGPGYFKSSARRPVRLLVRKLDRQQRIVSGTFAGMLYQDRGPDSLAVTDGRFDVKY